MKYSDYSDYLFSAVIYLGTQKGWWARTPSKMAHELNLDKKKLEKVFDGFPSIFRKSLKLGPTGEYLYSLQARYAQKEDGSEDDQGGSSIRPLDAQAIGLISDFIIKSAESERVQSRSTITIWMTFIPAIVTAVAALIAVFASRC